MAFVIAGPRSQVCIDDVDEPLLGQLPRRYGLRTPRCNYLWERFYGDLVLRKCDEIIAVCDEAIAADQGLACSSD